MQIIARRPRTRPLVAAVLVLGMVAIGVVAVNSFAASRPTVPAGVTDSAAPPPDPDSAASRELSENLLVSGDQNLIAAERSHRAGQPMPTTPGSWYAGYTDYMVSGNHAKAVSTTFAVPKLDCAHSTYGTSNEDIIYMWSGLNGTAGLPQDGLEAWCIKGQTTAHYKAWVYICCSGNTLTYAPWTPSPGDNIHAVVCRPQTTLGVCNGTLGFHFLVEDKTTGQQWTVDRFCPSTLTCDNTSAYGIFEVANAGAASLGTQWDLPKYTWPGSNGNIGATVYSNNGNGNFLPLSGAWTKWQWQMYDSNSRYMTTTGNTTDGQHWTYTYDSGI